MKYYSFQRPIVPCSYPRKDLVKEVVNFTEKTYLKEIDHEVWGYVDYFKEISNKDAADYELYSEKEFETKVYDVWICDKESEIAQPARVKAKNEKEARQQGLLYIRMRNLKDAKIEKIEQII